VERVVLNTLPVYYGQLLTPISDLFTRVESDEAWVSAEAAELLWGWL
jgi:hypothetical protein